MKGQPKQTQIPGITEDMIPAAVAGAKLAYERTPFDEWLYDFFTETLPRFGMIFRHRI